MARFNIPPPDVAPIDLTTGRWTQEYYDIIKGLERLGLLDLFDISTTAPTNGQVMIYDATAKKFVPGAN